MLFLVSPSVCNSCHLLTVLMAWYRSFFFVTLRHSSLFADLCLSLYFFLLLQFCHSLFVTMLSMSLFVIGYYLRIFRWMLAWSIKCTKNKLEYTISLNRVHTQPGQPGVKHTQIPQYQDQKYAIFQISDQKYAISTDSCSMHLQWYLCTLVHAVNIFDAKNGLCR